jgi:hypothetical protein
VTTGARLALDAVVLIVRFEVPDALFTEGGLKLQVGGTVVAGAPFSVMLQESATLWLNPPTDAIATVVVAEPPGATDAG